jgi:hypothetical protein
MMTLAGHVERVSNLFESRPDVRVDFENSMASSGYLPVHAPLYMHGYALGKLRVFRIEEGFPRIVPGDIPAGVIDVRYSLGVNSLGAYECDAARAIGPEREVDG